MLLWGAEAPVSPEPETHGRTLLAALAASGQVPRVLLLLQELWEPPASCAGGEAQPCWDLAVWWVAV